MTQQSTMGPPRMKTLSDWSRYFQGQTDSDLRSSWALWGRESEDDDPKTYFAWLAVNMEMDYRGFL